MSDYENIHPDKRDWSKFPEPVQNEYWKWRQLGADETKALFEALKVAISVAEERAKK